MYVIFQFFDTCFLVKKVTEECRQILCEFGAVYRSLLADGQRIEENTPLSLNLRNDFFYDRMVGARRKSLASLYM